MGFGDLLPQDVVEIFTQEKHGKRGRKKRRHSLRQALGWLRGKKTKNHRANKQNPGLGPALDLALEGHPAGYQGATKGAQRSGKQGQYQSNSHAVPKRDDDDDKPPAPPNLNENVFIEVSRPKYLEDLHTEALEGLKMMQQEERNYGSEYPDNESTISTMSAKADVDGGGFTTDSTIGDTTSMASVQSSVSCISSRSGLTRQGSTFRPLNSGKKSEKGKTRRRHRKTVGVIPQHIHRELGLDRVNWTVSPRLEEEFLNGETDESPSTDVPQLAVHATQEGNNTVIIQPHSSGQEGYMDNMALLHRLGPAVSGGDRPWSLAVPWMTTAGSRQPGPPSPVMSMSPQAAYMSKIIPNAVLPPSIEVVEISRGRSRNSLRTVSKSSLLLSSPASSRPSSRASSSRTTSSRSSTITSASRQNHFNLSDSSCWSNSDSSETLVSNSSTISSSSTPKQKEAQDSVNPSSNASKCTSNGKFMGKEDETKKDGPFARSLSVMKPKRAPPPPNRSYSLHSKMKRRSRDLAEVKIISGQTCDKTDSKIIDSPGYTADTSSLEDSAGSVALSSLKYQQNVDLAKTNVQVSKDASNEKKEPLQANTHNTLLSPSSGYSSQDAMSPSSSSPRHKQGILAKLHKLFPTNAGPSTSVPTQPEVCKNSSVSVSTDSENPSVKALRELFNIPPPPKVHAPPPPPPEVWSHSKQSIELLLGPPAPGNTYAVVKKNPKDRRQHRQSPSTSTEGSVNSLFEERKPRNLNVESINGASLLLEIRKGQESQEGLLNVENRTINYGRLIEKNVDEKGNSKEGKVQVSEKLNGILVKAIEKDRQRLPAIKEEAKTSTQTTSVNPSISLAHISPFTQGGPRPPTKQTAEITSIISVLVTSPESSWPPPPPPVPQAGLDEIDVPLPPPPLLSEDGLVLPVQVPLEKSIPLTIQQSNHSLSPATSEATHISNVATNNEQLKSSSLQNIKAPPLNIPPPPPYTAPPPPIKTLASSEPELREVSPTPPKVFLSPSKEVPAPLKISTTPAKMPSPPLKVSPATTEVPPSAPKELFPVQPKGSTPPAYKVSDIPPSPPDVPPPQSKEVSLEFLAPKDTLAQVTRGTSVLPVKELSPSQEMSAPPSTEILPPLKLITFPPPKEVLPPEHKQISTPLVMVTSSHTINLPTQPTPEVFSPPTIEVPSAPKAVSPSQSIETLNRPPKLISPPASEEMKESIPLKSKEVSPSTSEVSTTPLKELSPPQPIEVASPLKEIASPEKIEASPPIVVEVASSHVFEASSPPVVEGTPPLVVVKASRPLFPEESSLAAVKTVCVLSVEESIPKSVEEACQSSEEKKPSPLDSTPSIPTLPTDSSLLPLSQDPASLQQTGLAQENILNETDSILPSWKNILTPPQSIPPPPIEHPTPEALSSSEPQEVPFPSKVSPSIEFTTPPQTTEPTFVLNLPNEQVLKQEHITEKADPQRKAITSASVKQEELSQTVNGSQEPPKTEAQPEPEVVMETQEATNEVQTSSATSEAPQKPMRRSLIMSSTTPPVPSQPSLLKVPSSNTITPKSPSAISPSMNLQEAIRLRTAARSQNGPSSRLSLQSPPGFDIHKSPTSTASFIFAKSNKKVVIETRSEARADMKTEGFVSKASEEQTGKKEFKVPPPVAKKTKTKAKETDAGDTEQTAGQDAQSESFMDTTKKPNGTTMNC